jgi:hypothetical protein
LVLIVSLLLRLDPANRIGRRAAHIWC